MTPNEFPTPGDSIGQNVRLAPEHNGPPPSPEGGRAVLGTVPLEEGSQGQRVASDSSLASWKKEVNR